MLFIRFAGCLVAWGGELVGCLVGGFGIQFVSWVHWWFKVYLSAGWFKVYLLVGRVKGRAAGRFGWPPYLANQIAGSALSRCTCCLDGVLFVGHLISVYGLLLGRGRLGLDGSVVDFKQCTCVVSP